MSIRQQRLKSKPHERANLTVHIVNKREPTTGLTGRRRRLKMKVECRTTGLLMAGTNISVGTGFAYFDRRNAR